MFTDWSFIAWPCLPKSEVFEGLEAVLVAQPLTSKHLKVYRIIVLSLFLCRLFVKWCQPYAVLLCVQAVSVWSNVSQWTYTHSPELSEQPESEYNIRLKGKMVSQLGNWTQTQDTSEFGPKTFQTQVWSTGTHTSGSKVSWVQNVVVLKSLTTHNCGSLCLFVFKALSSLSISLSPFHYVSYEWLWLIALSLVHANWCLWRFYPSYTVSDGEYFCTNFICLSQI